MTPEERAAEVFADWVAECYAEHGHVAVFAHKHRLIERIANAIRAANACGWDVGRVAGRESVLHADTAGPA